MSSKKLAISKSAFLCKTIAINNTSMLSEWRLFAYLRQTSSHFISIEKDLSQPSAETKLNVRTICGSKNFCFRFALLPSLLSPIAVWVVCSLSTVKSKPGDSMFDLIIEHLHIQCWGPRNDWSRSGNYLPVKSVQ